MLEGVSIFESAAMLMPGVVRLGPMRVSVYGLWSAVGLIAALWLSQRTAKRVGIAGEQLWDAGWFAVTAAFVISRVLLVVRDWHALMTIPLALLSLPSFTYAGMGLTALAVVVYVKWKKLPMLAVMDAWAPCAALLAGALSLGHYFEGTDVGMPTSLRWGMKAAAGGRVWPVQLYGFAGAMVLFAVLMSMLRRPWRRGVVAGVALLAGGLMAFGLALIMQPVDWGGNAWLDPGQWIAIGAVVAGTLMLMFQKEIV